VVILALLTDDFGGALRLLQLLEAKRLFRSGRGWTGRWG